MLLRVELLTNDDRICKNCHVLRLIIGKRKISWLMCAISAIAEDSAFNTFKNMPVNSLA